MVGEQRRIHDLVHWSPVAEDEVDGPLDLAFLEVVAPRVIAERALRSVEPTAIEVGLVAVDLEPVACRLSIAGSGASAVFCLCSNKTFVASDVVDKNRLTVNWTHRKRFEALS